MVLVAMSRPGSLTVTSVMQRPDESSPAVEKITQQKLAVQIDGVDAASTASNTVTIDDLPVLDRGFRAWSTAAGCFLALFATQGYIAGYGPYQAYYETIFQNESRTTSAGSGASCFALGTCCRSPLPS